MAFNPFHGFRKHQKTFFAIMVIVCMFVFILQFGAGDAFTRALSWFGAGRGKGTVVATLNGTKVYETDLSQLNRQRSFASQFATYTFFTDPTAPFNVRLWEIVAPRGQFLFGGTSRTDDLLDFMVWRNQADRLGITLTESDLRKLISRELGQTDIFGGKSFLTSRLVHEATAVGSRNQRASMTPEDLQKALIDEFRVVLAHEALLGEAPGFFTPEARREQRMRRRKPDQPFQMSDLSLPMKDAREPAVTPGEFLRYYREQRTTLTVFMLRVNVNDFLAEAKKKPLPSTDDLEKLFQRYKGDVPAPDRAKPAFKEPERVKAEWVSASRDLPHFKEQARLRVELPEAFTKHGPRVAATTSVAAQVGLAATVVGAVGSPSPWLALAPAPNSFDRTLPRYSDYIAKQRPALMTSIDGKLNVRDYSFQHPSRLATIAGTLTGSAATAAGAGSVGSLAVAWGGAAGLSEVEEWQRLRNAQLALVGDLAGPRLGGALVPPLGALAYGSPTADYFEMRPRLLEELKEDELMNPLSGVLVKEMDDFSKELTKLKDKPDKAKQLIADTVKKYGLRHVAMTVPLDEYQLQKDDKFDPEKDKDDLKKLREEYLESQGGTKDLTRFSNLLLKDLKAPYEPKEFHRTRGDVYLVWQTEFVKAREYKSLAEARQKVEDAWYLEEARILARKQVEEWSAKARRWQSSLSVGEVEKRLREESKQDGFTLRDAARLVKPPLDPTDRKYAPYTPPASLVPYPRPNLVDQLVKQLKDKGDSMVLSDKPERVYYVAVLETRDDQENLAGFVKVLEATPDNDTLWSDHFLPARRRDFEKMVIKQLRLDAGATLNDDGDYVLPEGIRERGADNREGD